MNESKANRTGGRLFVAVFAAVAAAVLAAELFVPPVVGLADNGDFSKIMGQAGFRHLERVEDRSWFFVMPAFGLAPIALDPHGYRSSELLLAGATRLVASLFSPGGRMDIRVLGAVHAALLLAGLLALLVSAHGLTRPAFLVTAVLLVLVFTDVAYAAPLNSFYSQVASLVFLLLAAGTAGMGIRRGGLDGRLAAAFTIASALFVVSKPQEIVHAPLLAVLGVALSARQPRDREYEWTPAAVRGGALLLLAVAFYWTTPRREIHDVGVYQTVFRDILINSKNPERDLDDLGLDRSLVRYAGIHAYMTGSPVGDPAFRRAFFDRVGFPRVALFYLTHPDRFVDRIRRAAPAAASLRPRLGNFEREAGRPPGAQTDRFSVWSDLRKRTRPLAFFLYPGLLAATLAACLWRFRLAAVQERLFRIALATLVAMAAAEFLICAFADMLDDLPRHLFSFHAMIDLILIADVVWITEEIAWRWSPRLARSPGPA